jgi:putative tricarboxylic transport membrane protein
MSSVSTSGPGRGDAAGPSGSRTSSPLEPLRGRLGEIVFAGVSIALGLFALIGSFGIRVPESNRVGPTVFPVMVAVILLVSSVAVMIGVLRGRLGSPEESEDVDLSHGTDWIAILKLVVLVVAHLLLIGLVGWWLAAAVLFGGAAWSLGAKRWWVALLVGLGLGLAIQILFGELLGLSLPLGPVLGWLGPLI